MRPLVAQRSAVLVFASALLLVGCTGRGGHSARPVTERTAPVSAVPSPVDSVSTQVAQLLARPLHLPTIAPGDLCPTRPPVSHSPAARAEESSGFGTAPLYPAADFFGSDATVHLGSPGRAASPGPDGLYEVKVVWGSETYDGPVVVRLGRLDGTGRGHVALYYDASARRGEAVVFELRGVPEEWHSGTFVSGPGCWAYQVDGAGFSEVIPFRVLP
jgi:hypothetical protein